MKKGGGGKSMELKTVPLTWHEFTRGLKRGKARRGIKNG